MAKLKYPVDRQTFSKIIEDNCVYVDKTDLVYKMTSDYNYVFLSRPRRFGKSVLCSTLKEYFDGNKDLFKGLKIAELEKEWIKYPIIHLDFSSCKTTDLRVIKKYLSRLLAEYEHLYSLISDEDYNAQIKAEKEIDDISNIRLQNIINAAFQQTGRKSVIIIDEYDALMLNAIHDDKLQDKIREQMNNLFSPLKQLDPKIRFVFITGITKFSQMSIFSALNNLKDISLMPEYESVCGISMDEFLTQLKQGIQTFADFNGYTFEQTVKYFKVKYDGYHFSPKLQDIFNPYSVINALNEKTFNDYWFDSGTPTSLLKLINKFDIKMEDYDNIECVPSRFKKPVERVTDIVPFLYQSGYLTIKDYKSVVYNDNPTQLYILGYPNNEVRVALADSLFQNYYKVNDTNYLRNAFFEFSVNENLTPFMESLKKFFRRFPFSLNNMNEKHYHSILYTVLTSFAANVTANVETALGKSDLLLRLPKKNYIIELKYEQSVKSALDQIDDRDYKAALLEEDKPIVKLAITFSSQTRTIADWKTEEVR